MIRKNHSLKDISESIDRYSKENTKTYKEHNDHLVEITKHSLQLAKKSNKIANVGMWLVGITTIIAVTSVYEMKKAYSLSQETLSFAQKSNMEANKTASRAIALSEKSFSYFKKNSKETAETADKAINLSENALTFTKESFAESSKSFKEALLAFVEANKISKKANEIFSSQNRMEKIGEISSKLYPITKEFEKQAINLAAKLCKYPNKSPKLTDSTVEKFYQNYVLFHEIEVQFYLLMNKNERLHSGDVSGTMFDAVFKTRLGENSFDYEKATIAAIRSILQVRYLKRELEQLSQQGLADYVKPKLNSVDITSVYLTNETCLPYVNIAKANFKSSKAKFMGTVYVPSKGLRKKSLGLPAN